LSHTKIGLHLGFNSNFPTSIPDIVIWEFPPGTEYYLLLTCCSVISIAQEDENALSPGSPDGASSSHNLGQAHFIVKFDQHRSVLTVRLVKALNLSPLEKEWSKPCNPYVIVQLLPDYRHQLQSTVHKKTTNPRFDETFEFEVRKNAQPFGRVASVHIIPTLDNARVEIHEIN